MFSKLSLFGGLTKSPANECEQAGVQKKAFDFNELLAPDRIGAVRISSSTRLVLIGFQLAFMAQLGLLPNG
jgi:hypothetical protein